jgi:zinc transport system permease protein
VTTAAACNQHQSADHQHIHGEGCGHETVQHGDHVDYVHDGHRHAVHVDQTGAPHYDEH